MRRSEMKNLIKDIIVMYRNTPTDFISNEGIADVLLSVIENKGMQLCEYGEPMPWEPEEGWDKYFEEQDRKDQLRDFKVVNFLTERTTIIANKFLQGQTFEELAEEYTVTRERIRQIIAKARRAYQKGQE